MCFNLGLKTWLDTSQRGNFPTHCICLNSLQQISCLLLYCWQHMPILHFLQQFTHFAASCWLHACSLTKDGVSASILFWNRVNTCRGAAVGISSKRGTVGGGAMTGAGLNSSTLATSLSIFPSQEQWPAIQDIRKSHDRQAWCPIVSDWAFAKILDFTFFWLDILKIDLHAHITILFTSPLLSSEEYVLSR